MADDPKALPGWEITARSRPTEPGYRGPYTTHWVRETTGEDGRIEFPPLANGQVVWEIKAPEGSNYLVDKQPGATIRAGGMEEVEIKVLRAVRVEGTVLEEPGGAPIPGVTIDLHLVDAPQRSDQSDRHRCRGAFFDPRPAGSGTIQLLAP